MITLAILLIVIFCVVLTILSIAGGLVAIILDVAIAVGVIYLVYKLVIKIIEIANRK